MRTNQQPASRHNNLFRASLYMESEQVNKAFDLAEALREVMIAAGCRVVDEEELAEMEDGHENN